MTLLKELRQKASQYEKDNPTDTLADAYVQGYKQCLREQRSPVATMQMEYPASPSEACLGNFNLPSFSDFWNAYGKKVGKKDCQKKWNRLSLAQKVAVMAHVPLYVASTPEVQFRMHPLTYLNGEHWEDQIINSQNNKPNAQQQERDYLHQQAGIIQDLFSQ